MRTDFVKMHGLGNDFVVLHAPTGGATLDAAGWRALADRHRGIGFDQALVIEPARRDGTEAFYRIFNADGAEVEQCGNGARCIAELLRLEGRATNGVVAMECPGGLVNARFGSSGQVAVDMGEPRFDAAALPFTSDRPGHRQEIAVDGEAVRFGIVSMGNPHAVIDVVDVDAAPVARLGPRIESHARFPRRVNVGFLQLLDRRHGKLRVFERGAGETQACGTGACAAMAVARLEGRVDDAVELTLPGGTLTIRWAGPGNPLWLEGPAEVSFRGNVDL
ncbi:diaminopimelate epimerase [bacterium]|nr:MAG: diaminopimelate epimerase [bacterium]